MYFLMFIGVVLIGAAALFIKREIFFDDNVTPSSHAMSLLKTSRVAVIGVGAICLSIGLFNKTMFYAEPGYIYHVRTILGEEKVVSDVGYNSYLFGRVNAWKRAMTVQTVGSATGDTLTAETETNNTSASLPSFNVTFIDQVDADIDATVRFSLPTDREAFLKMAHEYRSPENLLRTSLIPAFKETLKATAQLISAEDYYSGGQTTFITDFEDQLETGIFIVKRSEKVINIVEPTTGSANASKGANQDKFGDQTKVIFVVNKILDKDGIPKRKTQGFADFGITVVTGNITDVKPNPEFLVRMKSKQKASADRAIAKEQRIQEQEQEQLAIAKGKREVAEKQAAALVLQIEATTAAETEKQLAITEANKQLESAEIDKQTAEVNLAKAKIEAQTVQTLADAEAYQKQVILEADNALAQKLEAEIQIQRVWAEAYAKRQVPTTVFGSGGETGVPVGSDGEVKAFMQMMTVDAAKRLNYARDLDTAK